MCVLASVREKRGLGGRRERGRGEINQQAGIEASQSGSERAAESRVEGEGENEVSVCRTRKREDRQEGKSWRKENCGSNSALDNGGAVGVCGASRGPSLRPPAYREDQQSCLQTVWKATHWLRDGQLLFLQEQRGHERQKQREF